MSDLAGLPEWLLPEYQQLASPHFYRGRQHSTIPDPPPVDTLILHYAVDGDQSEDEATEEMLTATARGTDCWDVARGFARPQRNASAHFCVGRDGSAVQCVRLRDAAWHAGDGRMHPGGVGPLAEVDSRPRVTNLRSVGIEISNVGWAVDRFGVPPDERETGKHDFQSKPRQWEAYDPRAIATLGYLVAMLRQAVPSLRYVLGHEDVTNADTLGRVGGKTDPGPVFPWDDLNWAGLGYERVRYSRREKAWVSRP